MTQTTSLPGHLITIRLYNQPLAQALLDAGIAVEPDTSGVRFACRADPKGTIEARYGWEEAKDLTRYGLAEVLADLTPADKQEMLAEILSRDDVKAGCKGSLLKEIYYEYPGTEGFVTTWLDGDTVIKEERCDDEGEILSLVTDGHLTELRWEHIPPQTRVICQRTPIRPWLRSTPSTFGDRRMRSAETASGSISRWRTEAPSSWAAAGRNTQC